MARPLLLSLLLLVANRADPGFGRVITLLRGLCSYRLTTSHFSVSNFFDCGINNLVPIHISQIGVCLN